MDILAATYTYRTTTYTSPYATSSVDATQLGAFFAGFAIFFITMIIIGLLVNGAYTKKVDIKAGKGLFLSTIITASIRWRV